MSEAEAVTAILPPPGIISMQGATSFFGDNTPLPEWVGWTVVLGFGLLFSIITTAIVFINKHFGSKGEITSEHFK